METSHSGYRKSQSTSACGSYEDGQINNSSKRRYSGFHYESLMFQPLHMTWSFHDDCTQRNILWTSAVWRWVSMQTFRRLSLSPSSRAVISNATASQKLWIFTSLFTRLIMWGDFVSWYTSYKNLCFWTLSIVLSLSKNTVLFIFQNTTFRRLDSVSVLR
jgi:hypothetical protein